MEILKMSNEISQEEFIKLSREKAADTLRGVFYLVDQVEFELQDVIQNCQGMDRIDDVTIKKINELNYKISVLKEAGNNIYERKRRLEHENGYPCDGEEGDEDSSYEGFLKVGSIEISQTDINYTLNMYA
jgi:hypothetical protein